MMGLALIGLRMWWPFAHTNLISQSLFLLVGITAGTVTYLAAGWLLGMEEVRALGDLVMRRGMHMLPFRGKV